MDRVQPRDRGIEPGEALAACGRAERWRTADGGELWRLPIEDEGAAERLLELAAEGVGGFALGGIDDRGAWLVRSVPEGRLDHLLGRAPRRWPWRRAVSLWLALARALAACEARSLFAGRLTPREVALGIADDDGDRVHVCLPADALVGAMVGEPVPARVGDSDARELMWMPPEYADGRLWDSAANRYALGVIAYRVLSGEHPFGGAGLRHALAEACHAEAAPFAPEVARELPPGLMSLCLRMLAPRPGDRPKSAAAILEALEALVCGRTRPSRSSAVPEAPCPAPRARAKPAPAAARRARAPLDLAWLGAALLTGRRARYAPLAAGSLGCVVVLALAFAEPGRAPQPTVRAGDERALDAAETRAENCAACHPLHAAEWSQSVMGHAVKSPLFNALEALIEEQVGRDRDCPGGAGILRRAGPGACRDRQSGVTVTGSGGEHWCVNCHAPGDNLASAMPAWDGRPGGDARTRHPVRDLITPAALEGISCAFCHQVHGPVGPNGSPGYQGNPSWVSFETGRVFLSRPEDGRGLFGIANSGYRLDPSELLLGRAAEAERLVSAAGFAAHLRPRAEARAYLSSSEFCGSCHDVRLFGSDVLGTRDRGEHFKRLRNAYSEWADWAAAERAAGRRPASCQDCHMSTYPGVCEPGPPADEDPRHAACPETTHFVAHEPGRRMSGRVATSSGEPTALSPHYFTGVDLPLAREIADAALDQEGLDVAGIPLSSRRRRDLLLKSAMRLDIGEARRAGELLAIPLRIENVGGGHKVPAGFSQERELWVHLLVEDGAGRVLYEVGRVDRNDEDLRDKVFLRVNTDPDRLDALGRPAGLFGADVRDGPDVPRWSPPPELGGDRFRGKGLINFQNGFLRCVRCVGELSPSGECLGSSFERHRAERFVDGDYDIDTGECRSNLSGRAALFETYFPVGALDADRGLVKGPDAIIDTRALPPGRPVEYTYELSTAGRPGPYRVTARLMFRSFPPFLVRAFAEYEAKQAARGRRPSGPLVTFDMLERLERVELARRVLVVP